MRVWLAYFATVAIWTTTPLAIHWSGQVDWFFGVASRLTLSAILILPFALWFSGQHLKLDGFALKVYAAASIGLLGGMTPIYWAAQTMPSGWIALIWGLTPILTGLLVHFLLAGHQLTPNRWLGILVSLIGLFVLFTPNLDTEQLSLQLMGILLAISGAFFHSLSTVLVKKTNHDLPPIHVVTGALWITSLVFVILNPTWLLNWPELTPRVTLSIGYLVVIGSVIGFVLYYYVLKHFDALRLGMIPMITPVFALLLGYFANNEQLNLTIWLGTGLVILGLGLFELNNVKRYRQQRQLLTNVDQEQARRE